jgi:hypothetical protein
MSEHSVGDLLSALQSREISDRQRYYGVKVIVTGFSLLSKLGEDTI